jgi:hypothetical protein
VDAIAVLTCPQRPQYLDRTLADLDAAGAARCDLRAVFCDGLSAEPCAWPITYNRAGPSGARWGMWWILRSMKAFGVNRLVYCEDDIACAPGAIDRILETAILPEEALISFYDAKEFPGARRARPGVHDVHIMGQDGKGLFGACCMLIPRRTIEWVCRVAPGAEGMPEHADQALSWALRDSPWPVRGVHIPSLVQHVGDTSSMGHKRGQRAALFLVD